LLLLLLLLLQVSEQVDSLRVLFTDPVDYLVTPRVLASMIAGPILNVLCFCMGGCGIPRIFTLPAATSSLECWLLSVLCTLHVASCMLCFCMVGQHILLWIVLVIKPACLHAAVQLWESSITVPSLFYHGCLLSYAPLPQPASSNNHSMSLFIMCWVLAGIGASVLLADLVYDVPANVILDSARRALSGYDVITSCIKAWVFGLIISTVSGMSACLLLLLMDTWGGDILLAGHTRWVYMYRRLNTWSAAIKGCCKWRCCCRIYCE
jgi:hypothetical protein